MNFLYFQSIDFKKRNVIVVINTKTDGLMYWGAELYVTELVPSNDVSITNISRLNL